MQIDLRTVSIKPQRQTYGHIARRFGDKPASRYQEGSFDLQPTANFHYRPTWDPDREIFDATRTQLKMKDWYAFKDPRQYYYGAWTLARARQQDTAEANFDFVESRNLGALLSDDVRQQALDLLLPLRHVAWGANMNNAAICAYGYGTAITQPCMFHAMDNLAIAQYLTRIGLLLGDAASLATAKEHWLYAADWQGLRRCVEDCLVTQDWFELFIAQNLVLDGDALASPGGEGRAEDVLFALQVRAQEQVAVRAGYRLLEGGADVEEVYNFAWVHYLTAGIRIEL